MKTAREKELAARVSLFGYTIVTPKGDIYRASLLAPYEASKKAIVARHTKTQ